MSLNFGVILGWFPDQEIIAKKTPDINVKIISQYTNWLQYW